MTELAFSSARTVHDIATLEAHITSALRQALGHAAVVAEAVAKGSTAFHDVSGALRKTIRRGVRSEWALFVKAGDARTRYAGIVEDGSKAHEIRPKRTGGVSSRTRAGKERPAVLRFQINGRWVSARVVHHPGTKPTHFMQTARDQAEVALVQFVETGLNSAIG